MSRQRIIAILLACSSLMAAGTQSALARADSASSPSAAAVAQAGAAPTSLLAVVPPQETARAAKVLGLTPPAQVAFVPVCYYVYRYMYYCAGGRCAYIYRYVYVCN